MTFEPRNNSVAVKILAFSLGVVAACLVGFIRPGILFRSRNLAQEMVPPLTAPPVASPAVIPVKVDSIIEQKPEGPLERFKRNLLIATSSGEEPDKQYLANQLDLFSIRGTPRFRADVLAADKDLAQIEKLSISSPILSRAAARFLGVSAADRVVAGNPAEAKRLLSISERLQPGLDLQHTVRAALLRSNGRVARESVNVPAFESSTESFAERALSLLLALLTLAILVLVCIFAFVFYRRAVASAGDISESGSSDQADSGYIGKIRKLVVVPGKRKDGDLDGRDPSPEDEPDLKLKRAA